MRNSQRNVMNAIKMKRLELLDIVRANKEKHITEFNESVVDFKALTLKVASDNMVAARTGDLKEFKKIKPSPSAPASYEDSYKRAIRMLECSIEDVIEIEEDVFNQLVLDEWNWKHQFATSIATYKSGIGG
jgi:hypothetical protein